MIDQNHYERLLSLKLPALLALGAVVVKRIEDLRRFRLILQAYGNGATSLHNAHTLCLQHAKAWGADETLIGTWEQLRNAAAQADVLFRHYFGDHVPA
jgi:hypothetical protein